MRGRSIRALIVAGLGAGLVAAPAVAAPGDLDPTFGGDGRFEVESRMTTSVSDMLLQADGRIVTVGSYGAAGPGAHDAVLRVTPRGELDSTFGEGGRVPLPSDYGLNYMTIAADGEDRLVVAGADSGRLIVTRFSADGVLDSTFAGDGSYERVIEHENRSVALAIDDQNRIVVGTSGPYRGIVISRLLEQGTLDPTFAASGILSTEVGDVREVAALGIESSGAIVAAGSAGRSFRLGRPAILRLDRNGTVDRSFGGDGLVTAPVKTTSYSNTLAIGPDGRYVLGGALYPYSRTGESGAIVVRFNRRGVFDRGFGRRGIARFESRFAYYADLAIQEDGSIVAAGATRNDFLVARYTRDGRPDRSFSANGRAVNDLGANADYASAVAVQADGRIVAGGARLSVQPRSSYDTTLAVQRYRVDRGPHDMDADGRLDAVDACPNIAAAQHRGCPYFVRTLRIEHRPERDDVRVSMDNAGGPSSGFDYKACFGPEPISVWIVRPGPDEKVATIEVSGQTPRSAALNGRSGRLYAVAREHLVSKHGICSAARSRSIRVGDRA